MREITYNGYDGETITFYKTKENLCSLTFVDWLDTMSDSLPKRELLFEILNPMIVSIDNNSDICDMFDIESEDCETVQELIRKICLNPGMLKYQKFALIAPGKGHNVKTGESNVCYICSYSSGPGVVETVVWDNDNRLIIMPPFTQERGQGTVPDAVLLLSNKLAFDLLPDSKKTKSMIETVNSSLENSFQFLLK